MAKTSRRRRRPSPPQPNIYVEIQKKETLEIIKLGGHAFFLGDGVIDPNVNDNSLTRYTGEDFLVDAYEASNLRVRKNKFLWQGDVLRTAFHMACSSWRNDPQHQQRRRPMIYRVDHEAMGRQQAWAVACGGEP